MNTRPSKITPQIRARCLEIAKLKKQTPTYKELEIETGINHNYLAKVVHELIAELDSNKNYASRGTFTEEEMQELERRLSNI